MANIVINDLNIYYEKSGRKKEKVLLLHGWGQNTEMMAYIANHLKTYFTVYNLDLPGFGKSDEPKTSWSVENYTDFIRLFCIENKIENPIIIGHSFGCRIAQVYASKYPVSKMVLTGAAGVRDKRTMQWYIKTYTYKLGKKLLSLPFLTKYQEQFKKNAGSEDYKNSSGVMRETLVKVVNHDTSSILKDIKTETLLVFGENDTATPVSKGKYMEENMPNATLIVFENDDHYAYFHQSDRFNRVLDAFLLENK